MPVRGTASESTGKHRLVRRPPFGQRLAAYLNPLDNLLSVTMIFEGYDWDAFGESVAIPAGILLNLILMVTRANSNPSAGWRPNSRLEEVLIDPSIPYHEQGSGYFGWFMNLLSYLIFLLCLQHSIYTLQRARPYRNFEADVTENAPAPTPTARRVRVFSPPNESAATRILKSLFPSLQYKASPPIDSDGVTQDEVWEIPKWDPSRFNLALSTYFSPIHCLVIFCLLPYTPPKTGGLFADVPSTTYSASWMAVIWHITLINTLLSVYLHLFFKAFKTQAGDEKYIHGQVLAEYKRKFVNPRVSVEMRDVGTSTHSGGTVITAPNQYNPGFKTFPSPAYQRYAEERPAGGIFDSFRKTSSVGTDMQTNPFKSTTPAVKRNNGTTMNGNAYTPRTGWSQRLNAAGVPATQPRQSFGIPGCGPPTATGRKSFAAGDLMTPARRVAAAAAGQIATPKSVSKTPGRNGNVWGGGVDYGVASPMKTTKTRRRDL